VFLSYILQNIFLTFVVHTKTITQHNFIILRKVSIQPFAFACPACCYYWLWGINNCFRRKNVCRKFRGKW